MGRRRRSPRAGRRPGGADRNPVDFSRGALAAQHGVRRFPRLVGHRYGPSRSGSPAQGACGICLLRSRAASAGTASLRDFSDGLASEAARGSQEDRHRRVFAGSHAHLRHRHAHVFSCRRADSARALSSPSRTGDRPWENGLACRVFQSHGTQDPILPYVMAERLRDELVKAGLTVEWQSFRGVMRSPSRSLSGWAGS